MLDCTAVRVAVTIEQCWHRVPGGTAWSILELLRALIELPEDELELVGVSARHRRPPLDPWVPPVQVRSLPLPRVALYETWHAPMWRGPRVERATGAVDLVHATAVAYPAATAPVVVTVHDLAFLGDARLATRHGHRFFRRGTELARRDARLVTVPSEATRSECERAGFDPGRIRVVPWGVRPIDVDGDVVAGIRSEAGLDRRYILFCGTAEPRKNLPGLLDAFLLIRDLDVDLVLAGPAGWHEDVDDLVRARPALGPRIKRLGFVDRRQLDALMAGADAFCYPSLQEGFGLPVLEAMAAGAPVVTSTGTATAEVAGDAAVTVDPTDHEAIAAALDDVLGDDGLAARLRAAGRQRASELPWERSARAMLAVYREAIRH